MKPTDGKDTGSRSTRRGFAKTVALLAATPLIAPPEAIPSEEKSTDRKTGEIVTEALMEIVQARYGQYLTPEQMKEVKKSLERKQRTAETLKKVKLQNRDEPAFIFFADLP